MLKFRVQTRNCPRTCPLSLQATDHLIVYGVPGVRCLTCYIAKTSHSSEVSITTFSFLDEKWDSLWLKTLPELTWLINSRPWMWTLILMRTSFILSMTKHFYSAQYFKIFKDFPVHSIIYFGERNTLRAQSRRFQRNLAKGNAYSQRKFQITLRTRFPGCLYLGIVTEKQACSGGQDWFSKEVLGF